MQKMTNLKYDFQQLTEMGNLVFELKEDLGEFVSGSVISVGSLAKPEILKHYKNIEVLDEVSFIAKNKKAQPLDLKYFIEKSSEFKFKFYNDERANKTPKEMATEILQMIVDKEDKRISEYIVEHFLARNKVYTVRDDNTAEIWIYQEGIYISEGKTYIQQFVRLLLGTYFKMPICKEVVDKVMIDSYINPDLFFSFDNHLNLIPVLNGLLDMNTLKLQEFDPNKIFFNKLPIVFDKSADCPQIKEFFEDICRDKSDIETLQQFLGTCLERESKYERMLMCIGGGRNGKSKFADLVKKFLGSYNCAGMQPSSLENPDNFNTYMLHGKLANMYMDIARTSLKNTSLLKSLSGGDPITVPRKYKSPLTFKNTANFIFGANELPYSYDITSGFWERWLLIDFPYTFMYEDRIEKLDQADKWKHKVRIDNITDKICTPAELSGLLNWVISGLHQLRADGKFSYKYTPEQVKSMWIRKSDSFSAYFMDFMEVDYDKKVLKSDLRKYYSEYCKNHNLKIMSDMHINKIMGENGISGVREQLDGKSDMYWVGATFKSRYKQEANLNGIVTFKKPTQIEEVKNYIQTNKNATKQDVIMCFGERMIKNMFEKGDLIELPNKEVKLR